MKYVGIDQPRLKGIIDQDKYECRNTRYLILAILIGIVLTVIFILIMCDTKDSIGLSERAQMGMLLAILSSSAVAVGMLVLYGGYFKIWQRIRRNTKRLIKDVSLEINGNKIIYFEDSQIKEIDNISKVMLDDNYIKVSNNKSQVLIDRYINNSGSIYEVLSFLVKVTKAKDYENEAFKQLLRISDSSNGMFYNEIKQMYFLMPINHTFDYFDSGFDSITLSSGLTYQYETIVIPDKGKYICCYTSNDEIKDNQFIDSIVVSYQKIFELIDDSNIDIFKEGNGINGIVINPSSDNVLITMNRK